MDARRMTGCGWSRRLLSASLILFLSACNTTVSFRTGDIGIQRGAPAEEVTGYFAKPDGKGPFPAVVLLHTCGGIRPHVSEDWPSFLTRHGFATLTVDTFGSRGAGRCPEAKSLGRLPMWRDAYGALDYLANRHDIDGDRIAVMGFSLGANAVEMIASNGYKSGENRNFRAGIAVYGKCNFFNVTSFPVPEIIGDQDKNSSNCPARRLSGVSIAILKGAYHAFDQSQHRLMRVVSGGHNAIYDSDATEKAQALTLSHFQEHLAAK